MTWNTLANASVKVFDVFTTRKEFPPIFAPFPVLVHSGHKLLLSYTMALFNNGHWLRVVYVLLNV